MNGAALRSSLTGLEREEALGGIINAYNHVTDQLKDTYDRLRTEVVRLREELERKNVELRRRERLAALGQMAAGLAHEIRNPLGGIALHASMLERDLRDMPDSATLARRIREGVRTLDRLVTDVLSFAQEGQIEPQPVLLSEIIAQTTVQLEPSAVETGVKLIIDEQDPDVVIHADAARIRQVLVNLVLNGVQACGCGGSVTIATRAAADGRGAELVISDDGPGIAAEDIERIFNPFVTTKAGGTGLGLSIVHRIVEAHGGGIRVRSTPGSGASFILWLPLSKDQTEADGKTNVMEASSGEAFIAGRLKGVTDGTNLRC